MIYKISIKATLKHKISGKKTTSLRQTEKVMISLLQKPTKQNLYSYAKCHFTNNFYFKNEKNKFVTFLKL